MSEKSQELSLKKTTQGDDSFTLDTVKKLIENYVALAKQNKAIEPSHSVYQLLADISITTNSHLAYLNQKTLETFLFYASGQGHTNFVVRLITQIKVNCNCSIKIDGSSTSTPLLYAIEENQLTVVELLILNHANLFIEDKRCQYASALECALILRNQNQDIINSLVKYIENSELIIDFINDLENRRGKFKAFSDTERSQAIDLLNEKLEDRKKFFEAARKGNTNKLTALLDKGVCINALNEEGKNALFIATEFGQVASVAALIEGKARLITVNKKSAIQIAMDVWFNSNDKNQVYHQIIKLLFHRYCHVEVTDNDNTMHMIRAKLISTLLYVSKRHHWQSDKCKNLHELIQYICRTYLINSSLINATREVYQDWMKSQNDCYGSYLSSDSDSDEEKLFSSLKGKIKVSVIDNNPQAKKLFEWEQACYLDEEDKNLPSPVRLKQLFTKKTEVAKKITIDPALNSFRKVFTENNKHFFRNNGQVHLYGTTKKAKLSPIYANNQIGSESPLVHRSTIDSAERSPVKKYFVADYRGYAYIVTQWDKEARMTHRKRNELYQPLNSMSVLFNASNTKTFSELFKYECSLSQEELQAYNERKKSLAHYLKQRIRELSKSGKARLEFTKNQIENDNYIGFFNSFTYDNLGELLQTVYTCNYDLYFKLLNCEFFRNRLLSGDSPFVSTAQLPYHAFRYAYGLKTFSDHQDETLDPSWRSDGEAERPYVGKVYIILHPLEDMEDAFNLTTLQFEGKSNIPLVISPERETSYFSSIENDRIVYQHVAKYPSFKGNYKQIYLYKYGMDAQLYEYFKNYLAECRKNFQYKKFKNLLGEYLCAYHEMRFLKIAQQQAKLKGGVLVYLDEFGNVKKDGKPAEKYSPIQPMKDNSPQKKYKDNKTTPSKQRRKNDQSYQLLIDNRIFNTRDERIKLFAKTLFEFENNHLSDYAKHETAYIKKVRDIEVIFTTLLHFAMISNQIFLAKKLINLIPVIDLQRKVNNIDYFNLRDRHGNTPLHLAELIGNPELIRMLMERRANQEIINHQGLKPRDMTKPSELAKNDINNVTDNKSIHRNLKSEFDKVHDFANNDEELPVKLLVADPSDNFETKFDPEANGLKLQRIAADGNCFFGAIAFLLNQYQATNLTHLDIRREAIHYLRNHPQLQIGFGEEMEEGTLDAYLKRMENINEFAVGPIIDAAALRYGVRLNIIDSREDEEYHFIHINEQATDKPLLTLLRSGEDLKCQHYDAYLQVRNSSLSQVTSKSTLFKTKNGREEINRASSITKTL